MSESVQQRPWQARDWEEQIDRIIGFTNIARITIFFTLMMFAAFSQQLSELFEIQNNHLSPVFTYLNSNGMHVWLWAYGIMTIFCIVQPNWQKQKHSETPSASAVADITMMVLLTHLLGGVNSGFAILILPFLAISCLLSYGRYPMLYAGYASILLLLFLIWREWPFSSDAPSYFNSITGNILLIAGCYLVSLLTSYSASFLSRAGESVKKHRTAFERISALNKVVLNRMQEAVLVVDADCRVWLHNRQTLQYFSNIKPNSRAPFLRDVIRRWQGNSKQLFETSLMINERDMNVRAVPVIQENTELLILFIRAEKERQLEAQSVKLASLGLLTANFAHEIRNPLSAVRQANGLMIENNENEERPDPMTAKLCGIIDKNIARIDKMIEEVSSLNKRDRINRQTIIFEEFWNNFYQEFLLTRPEAANGIAVSIVKNTAVIFDAMHLQQILWNLCNNAWRHGSKRKHSVTLTVYPHKNGNFSLRVFDDGGGVPDNIIQHLFEPFYTTQAEGTGLGLYIARELAHANKGDLRYLPDKKAFELILPKAES
ncbi:ATP-binding protein [Conchiformibius steedae]|uniref:histidine kinase n=1 Tax=Conchiformibius steedae TaxID=153493 RepID=A0A3P2A7Y7_9NEIS|nr:HAMP domain-containing sensor histidine kinase [Conchiformibius steedae]RRD91484.1 sensor histidine kinase [Conchiformibius steedae]